MKAPALGQEVTPHSGTDNLSDSGAPVGLTSHQGQGPARSQTAPGGLQIQKPPSDPRSCPCLTPEQIQVQRVAVPGTEMPGKLTARTALRPLHLGHAQCAP